MTLRSSQAWSYRSLFDGCANLRTALLGEAETRRDAVFARIARARNDPAALGRIRALGETLRGMGAIHQSRAALVLRDASCWGRDGPC